MYNCNGTSYGLLHLGLKSPAIACLCVAGYLYYGNIENVKYVSFTFDDGHSTDFDIVKPLFDKNGIRASLYPIVSSVDQIDHITYDQLKTLYKEGWEIGSHTVNHYNLTTLEDQTYEIEYPLEYFRKDFVISGIASPFGEYNEISLNLFKENYNYHLKAWGGKNNLNELNQYELNRYQLDHLNDKTALEVCNEVKTSNEKDWFIFLSHKISIDNSDDYVLKLTYLEDLISCLKEDKNIVILPVNEVLRNK